MDPFKKKRVKKTDPVPEMVDINYKKFGLVLLGVAIACVILVIAARQIGG